MPSFRTGQSTYGILGTILASTIRVVDQPGCRAFRCHSMEQRLVDQVFRHPGAHGIADYLSGVHVLVSGKIEPALIRRDIRNVSQPDLARRRSLESLLKQVLRQRQTMTGVRRRFKPAFLFTLQAKFLSKTPDAMNSDRYPMVGQVTLQPFRTVGLSRTPMRCPYLHFQSCILLKPSRRRTATPSMVAARGHTQNTA